MMDPFQLRTLQDSSARSKDEHGSRQIRFRAILLQPPAGRNPRWSHQPRAPGNAYETELMTQVPPLSMFVRLLAKRGRRGVRNVRGCFVLIAAALAGISSSPCVAATPSGNNIAHQGTGAVPACTGCHGPALLGQPAMRAPALAGLPSGFIVARLGHYAGPTGHNATMRAVAQGLTDPERRAVAAYLAKMPKGRAPPIPQ
jgi:cytochrome c553